MDLGVHQATGAVELHGEGGLLAGPQGLLLQESKNIRYTTTTIHLSGEPGGGGTTCRLAMVRRRASSDSVATGTMKGESGTCSSLNLMETS